MRKQTNVAHAVAVKKTFFFLESQIASAMIAAKKTIVRSHPGNPMLKRAKYGYPRSQAKKLPMKTPAKINQKIANPIIILLLYKIICWAWLYSFLYYNYTFFLEFSQFYVNLYKQKSSGFPLLFCLLSVIWFYSGL